MSHRVNPKIFRIGNLVSWDSRWLQKKNTAQSLEEDFKIREFLKKKFQKNGIEKVEIEKFPGRINIIISSARPGMIIGRGGQGVEELKKELEKVIGNTSNEPSLTKKQTKVKKEIKIEIREVKNPWLSSALVAQWMVQQIEKRVPYRRVLKQALEKISSQKGVEGVKVEVAGRLDGTEIARREWLKKGRLPRQTLRADIDYAQAEAFCTYGVVGAKVWIYKGDKF
jgi:small subunit ribosomal protein S3